MRKLMGAEVVCLMFNHPFILFILILMAWLFVSLISDGDLKIGAPGKRSIITKKHIRIDFVTYSR